MDASSQAAVKTKAAGHLAAAALAALALLVAIPASSAAAEKAIWGPLDLPDGRPAFPVYDGLGVDTFQIQLRWPATARNRPARPTDPRDPAYRWPPALDRAVAEAAARRIRLAVLVRGSPAWANGGRSEIHAPDPQAFADFMSAASRRYPSVRRWMVWGEPNRADRFQPNAAESPASARAYARILDAAYASLKAVSRRNVVIGGMTWTGGTVKPANFLRFMRLPDGRPPRLDWFGHNPFPYRFPNLAERPDPRGFRDISDLDTLSRQLRGVYGRRARFWLSEFTIVSDTRSNSFELFVSRREQARWLAAAFRIADGLPSVAGLGWFSLLDQRATPFDSNWGLLTASGSRKPAYAAYRAAPSARLRPRVRAPRRVARRELARRGLTVRVRPRVGGRLSAGLTSRRGRRLARVSRRARAGRALTLTLRPRRLSRGRYTLAVRAPRAETVRRALLIR